ncbi:unnamed protein product [Closterium sp. NIES-65]|nr:unnamed protein product [Closterium sp. NIES-65]
MRNDDCPREIMAEIIGKLRFNARCARYGRSTTRRNLDGLVCGGERGRGWMGGGKVESEDGEEGDRGEGRGVLNGRISEGGQMSGKRRDEGGEWDRLMACGLESEGGMGKEGRAELMGGREGVECGGREAGGSGLRTIWEKNYEEAPTDSTMLEGRSVGARLLCWGVAGLTPLCLPLASSPCVSRVSPFLPSREGAAMAISESTEKQSQLQVPLSFSAACAAVAEEAEEEAKDPRTDCDQTSTGSVADETSCSNGTSSVSCSVSNDTIYGKDVRLHSDGGRWLVAEVAVGSGGATADALNTLHVALLLLLLLLLHSQLLSLLLPLLRVVLPWRILNVDSTGARVKVGGVEGKAWNARGGALTHQKPTASSVRQQQEREHTVKCRGRSNAGSTTKAAARPVLRS